MKSLSNHPLARFISKLIIMVVSTILTFIIVCIPLEIVLRTEYSKEHLLGVYVEFPERVLPTQNSQGYRDIEHTLEKPPGITRIVFVGDSFTFGWGVTDDEVYTHLLREMSGPEVEIISIAERGWSVDDYHRAMHEEVLAYDPDMVVVGVVTNDPEPQTIDPNSEHKLLTLQPDWYIFRRITRKLYVPFFLDYQISRLGDRLGMRYTYLDWEDDLYDQEHPNWEHWERKVDEMGTLLKEHDIPAYAFILTNVRTKTERELRKYRLSAETFSAAGFETIDLEPAFSETFAGYSPVQLAVFPNDGHPNERVHRFYAHEIWAVLEPAVEDMRE